MKLAVIGTGYVGLVSGVCLTSKGHSVTCFDINEDTINKLKKGICHIYEKGLEDLLASNKSHISFRLLDNESEQEIMDFDAVLVAVGTPTKNGRADLSQIESVGQMMGRLIRSSDKFISIIIKSTVLPGTTDTFLKDIVESESGKKVGDFGLGMNPEFLREGNAVEDFQYPDRIVFGFEDPKTLDVLKDIYKPWSCEKIEVNTRSAEMLKYVNNALLATLISTINEYSNIARAIEKVDFEKVMQGVHLDNRWSPLDSNGNKIRPKIIDYLKPGCGYGGSCFPKDVMAISSLAQDVGVPSRILSSVIAVNEKQPDSIIEVLKESASELNNKHVLILGLAFKPDTDDIRESVSLKLMERLAPQVSNISAHDPLAIENAKKAIRLNKNIDFVQNWKETLVNADIVIIATNWKEYLELKNMQQVLSGKVLFDTRSLFTPKDFDNLQYISVN